MSAFLQAFRALASNEQMFWEGKGTGMKYNINMCYIFGTVLSFYTKGDGDQLCV